MLSLRISGNKIWLCLITNFLFEINFKLIFTSYNAFYRYLKDNIAVMCITFI